MRKTLFAILFLLAILTIALKWLPEGITQAQKDEVGKNKAVLTPSPIITNNSAKPTATPTRKPSSDNQIKTDKGEEVVETSNQNKTDFYAEGITDSIKKRIIGKSYGKNCDVPFEDLRYVGVLYWGFDNTTHRGELIVNQAIAEDTVDIFKELYDQHYPIERMVLVDEYNADDNTSMAANNSSSFNYRNIDGTKKISLHSCGLAIDVNPLYNPYVRGEGEDQIITPLNGIKYADRSVDCPYFIKKDDVCYQAFIKRGFTWGGEWKSQKDYQHFQKVFD